MSQSSEKRTTRFETGQDTDRPSVTPRNCTPFTPAYRALDIPPPSRQPPAEPEFHRSQVSCQRCEACVARNYSLCSMFQTDATILDVPSANRNRSSFHGGISPDKRATAVLQAGRKRLRSFVPP